MISIMPLITQRHKVMACRVSPQHATSMHMLVVAVLALFSSNAYVSANTTNLTISSTTASNSTSLLSVIVKSNSELIVALKASSAGTILVAADIKLDPVEWLPYAESPIAITRNVTVQGVANGTRPPFLDSNWLFPILMVSEGFTFTIRNLVMSGADTNFATLLFTGDSLALAAWCRPHVCVVADSQ